MKDFEEMRALMDGLNMENDFRFNHGHVSFDNPVAVYINENITEGLIQTYPVDKTISYVKKYFNLSDHQIKSINPKNQSQPQIRVTFPNVGKNKELMDKAMNLCGYYPGFIETYDDILSVQYSTY